MKKSIKNNVTKVYCEKCDLVFDSREKFEEHFDRHSSNVSCEVCPIDTALSKFANLFRILAFKTMKSYLLISICFNITKSFYCLILIKFFDSLAMNFIFRFFRK